MLPNIKFLTVVWGDDYIERFATLALPSLLAPGNLPALAARTKLETLILTRRRDIETFQYHAAFRRLEALCSTRFIDMEDLIATGREESTANFYGYTLTLAYARAVRASGSDMLNTYFVFMNADFVLADGSLRSMLEQILAGRSIILAPSFRSTAEQVEEELRSKVDSSSVLTIAPRELASIALANPHPTTVAKTLTQTAFHSSQANQFFWQVDEHTMLGRYYLIFMLCLKPERIPGPVNTYCDYGFIPEMCPSGNEVVMGDSDLFFMLELQHHDSEWGLLREGSQTEEEIARSLSVWTTVEHRRAATYDIVFHSGDIQDKISDAKAAADAFVERIGKMLGPPIPHAYHRYWAGTVDYYLDIREDQGLRVAPPELDTSRCRPRTFLRLALRRLTPLSLLFTCHRWLMGRAPRVTPLHHSWLDYVHLREATARLLDAPEPRLLFVCANVESAKGIANPDAPIRFASIWQVLRDQIRKPNSMLPKFSAALIWLRPQDCEHVDQIVRKCAGLLKDPESSCYLFVQDSHGLGGGDLIRLTREIEIAVGHSATTESSVGGLIKQFNRGVLTRVGKHHSQIGLIAMTWIVPIGLFSLPLTLLMNLYQRSKFPSSGSVQHPSSLLLRLGLGRKAVRSTDKSTNIGASRAAWDAPGRGNCSSSL